MRRLAMSLAAVLVFGSVLSTATVALAAREQPKITATQVTFVIPASPTGVALNLAQELDNYTNDSTSTSC